MPDTHALGPIFVQSIWLTEGAPVFHTAPTNELEEPYRKSKSLIVRIPFSRRAVVLGFWRKTERTEDEALAEAVNLTQPREGVGSYIGYDPESYEPQIAREVPNTETIIYPADKGSKRLPERLVSYDGPFNLIDPTHKD